MLDCSYLQIDGRIAKFIDRIFILNLIEIKNYALDQYYAWWLLNSIESYRNFVLWMRNQKKKVIDGFCALEIRSTVMRNHHILLEDKRWWSRVGSTNGRKDISQSDLHGVLFTLSSMMECHMVMWLVLGTCGLSANR